MKTDEQLPVSHGNGESGSARSVMKDGGGHVVRLAAFPSVLVKGCEHVAEEIEGSITRVVAADIAKALEAKLLVVDIARFRQAVGAEEHGIAGLKL